MVRPQTLGIRKISLKTALCQIDSVQADPARNRVLLRDAASEAAGAGARLLIFPELALPGYSPGDWLGDAGFLRLIHAEEQQLISELPQGVRIIFGSTSRRANTAAGKALSNDAVFAERGRLLGRVAKSWLPEYDVFDEARYFSTEAPPSLWTFEGKSIGATICEDIWGEQEHGLARPRYEGDPPLSLVTAGADFICNLSASPYAKGRPAYRERLLRRLAQRFNRPLALCNLVGGNDDLIFDGHSTAVDAKGRVLVRAAGFNADIVYFDDEANGELSPLESHQTQGAAELDEIAAALVCGIRGYVHKTGFERVILGLSGGIDSALVAVLATKALGAKNVTGVAMPSRFSADMSEDDAAELARNLGIDFKIMPIEAVHLATGDSMRSVLGAELSPLTDENIQPRIRGLFLMALANETQALLLATGNKSELATGYCTLYGDMCGALAPIADLSKTSVFALSRRWNETSGGPIPRRSIERPPSAELRAEQADTDSLPPYDVLDDILEAAIEDGLSPAEIVARGHEPNCVRDVLRLVRHNEYKRRQMPPGLRVTKKAFGRGRRFPLAAGDPWTELSANDGRLSEDRGATKE